MPDDVTPPAVPLEPRDEDPWEGQDPSTITGKHNIVRIQRGLEPLEHAPWWAKFVYGVLEKWGVPTVVLFLVMAAFAYFFQVTRLDHKEESAKWIQALDQNTAAIRQLSEALKGGRR